MSTDAAWIDAPYKVVTDPPSPGSAEAVKAGCTCPVLDNHHGTGMPYPDGPRFWITAGCPVHDPKEAA